MYSYHLSEDADDITFDIKYIEDTQGGSEISESNEFLCLVNNAIDDTKEGAPSPSPTS